MRGRTTGAADRGGGPHARAAPARRHRAGARYPRRVPPANPRWLLGAAALSLAALAGGRCASLAPGALYQCGPDGGCPAGQACTGGYCAPTGCEETCVEGEVCQGGQCVTADGGPGLFVQGHAAVARARQSVELRGTQPGNTLIVAAEVWSYGYEGDYQIDLADSANNAFTPASVVFGWPDRRNQVRLWYAIGIKGGDDVITLSLDRLAPRKSVTLHVLEYRGVQKLEDQSRRLGFGPTEAVDFSSGPVSAAGSSVLLFAFGGAASVAAPAAASQFTKLLQVHDDADFSAARVVAGPGTWEAAASQQSVGPWFLQLLAFSGAEVALVQADGTSYPCGTATVELDRHPDADDVVLVAAAWQSAPDAGASATVVGPLGQPYLPLFTPAPTAPDGTRVNLWWARAPAAGGQSIRFSLDVPVRPGDQAVVQILEFAGLDPVSPVDAASARSGADGRPMSSGELATTVPDTLLFGFGWARGDPMEVGRGFTRLRHLAGTLSESRLAGAPGPRAATMTAVEPGPWIAAGAALKTRR